MIAISLVVFAEAKIRFDSASDVRIATQGACRRHRKEASRTGGDALRTARCSDYAFTRHVSPRALSLHHLGGGAVGVADDIDAARHGRNLMAGDGEDLVALAEQGHLLDGRDGWLRGGRIYKADG